VFLATSSNSGSIARFYGFELDLRNGQLTRDGLPLKLQPQPAKVLALLVSRPSEIITREELVKQVWGSDTFVDFEQGLNFAIRQIRAALGDDADQPRFVETLPKRGYRFIAPLTTMSDVSRTDEAPVASSKTRWIGIVAAVVLVLAAGVYFQSKSQKPRTVQGPIILAVLPFDDMSSQPQAFLVDGLTEEMVARVTEISPEHLKVIARTSAMQYARTNKSARQIGQELGADYVLENSVRHENGRLRITSQLVRTSDQVHLWAQNYDRDMRDLLPLESEVTSDIAEQVQKQLLPAVAIHRPANIRAVDADAHELYLKGRYAFNQRSRDSLQESVLDFQQALARQPNYAAAYAGLADSYNLIAFYGFDPTLYAVSQAKISADKALQLDDSMAAAHAALAYTEFMWQDDWQLAEREFRRAIELDDNYVPAHHWYALYLAAIGKMDESLREMQYAQRLDPLSSPVHAGSAWMYYFARNYDKALQEANTALQLNPNSTAAHAVAGWAYTEQKKYDLAIGELKVAAKLAGGVPAYMCPLARTYAVSGNTSEAKKIAAQAEAMQANPQGLGSAIAAIYVALGDSDRALTWLEETNKGDIRANWLRVDPSFDPLRGNARFEAVLNRLGTKRD